MTRREAIKLILQIIATVVGIILLPISFLWIAFIASFGSGSGSTWSLIFVIMLIPIALGLALNPVIKKYEWVQVVYFFIFFLFLLFVVAILGH